MSGLIVKAIVSRKFDGRVLFEAKIDPTVFAAAVTVKDAERETRKMLRERFPEGLFNIWTGSIPKTLN